MMIQPNGNALREQGAGQSNNNAHSIENSAAAQRWRILQWLRQVGTLTTLEARRELDVLHPAARVMELRNAGFNIETTWGYDHNGDGRPHRVARYAMLAKGAK